MTLVAERALKQALDTKSQLRIDAKLKSQPSNYGGTTLQSPYGIPIKVLRVPELVLSIFAWMDSEDLETMSKVCRPWCLLAFEVMGHKPTWILDLFNTYSKLSRVADSDYYDLWDFQESAVREWDMFYARASHIEKLALGRAVFTPAVWSHLNSQLKIQGHDRMLPILRAVTVVVMDTDRGFPDGMQLVPADLESLDIWGADVTDPHKLRDLLTQVNAIPWSRLSSFELMGSSKLPARSLDDLWIHPILQSRSTLTKLSLTMFPIEREDLERIGSIPNLRHLAVKLNRRVSLGDIRNLFDTIATQYPTLHSLEVILYEVAVLGLSLSDVIGQLKPCGELRKLCMKVPRWAPLTSTDVGYMGELWPAMEEFELHETADIDKSHTEIEIGVLQPLAEVWSQTLRHLNLPFENIWSAPKPSSVTAKFKRLETLGVGLSELESDAVDAVAKFLSAVTSGPLKITRADNFFFSRNYNWQKLMELMEEALRH
ncbi:hypothetical protein FRB90_005499 [Tulasnella sp. 427]|nr:hypothetical protein FRB90_005499 [Tulasnella sp. 427]